MTTALWGYSLLAHDGWLLPPSPLMLACPDCGADVRPMQAGGKRVVLDTVAQMSGRNRYRVISPGLAQAVSDKYSQPAYPVHTDICPARQGEPR